MKNKQRRAWWVVAMAALGSFNAVAASTPQGAAQSTASADIEFHTTLLERARAVAASGQPLDLLVASRLLLPLEPSTSQASSSSPSQSDGWLDEAIRIGSNQPAIARAAMTRCLAGGSCDIPVALQTLQTHESDEVIAQLLLWKLQMAKGDADAATQAWARATQATRYADDYAEGVALLDRATRGVPWPAPAVDFLQGKPVDGEMTRITTVFALAAAFWMPGPSDAYRQCPAGASAEQRQQCRHLFTVMADSGSTFAASIGIARMIDLSDGPAERQKWETRKRELAWLSQRTVELLSGETRVNLHDYLQWLGQTGELPAMRQLLASHDVAPKPPVDGEPARLNP